MNIKLNKQMQTDAKVPFNEEDFETIKRLVKTYDGLYKEMSNLEINVQKLLKGQESIVNELKSKRTEEEEFFRAVAEREGVEVSFLKKLASTWVEENKQ